jgi:predicted RNase H-like HicB family nuclease
VTPAPERRATAKEGTAVMLKIEIEREEDGRWIGEVPELPGLLAYGATEAEARTKTAVLALRVIADRIEHGGPVPFDPSDLFIAV